MKYILASLPVRRRAAAEMEFLEKTAELAKKKDLENEKNLLRIAKGYEMIIPGVGPAGTAFAHFSSKNFSPAKANFCIAAGFWHMKKLRCLQNTGAETALSEILPAVTSTPKQGCPRLWTG